MADWKTRIFGAIGGNLSFPVSNSLSGLANRSIFGQLFAPEAIALEDYQRNEQSAINAFNRQSEFNAIEAQKQRDFEERMANTSFQRVVKDMKIAGINPIIGLGLRGADTPSGVSASASSSSGSVGTSAENDLVPALLSILAGVITKGKGGSSPVVVKNFINKLR